MKIAFFMVMFKYKFFNIPAVGDGKLEDELNGFLGSHSILDVKQEFSPDYGLGGSWCFCIRWKEGLGSGEVTARTNRKDYKEILGEEEFSLYLGLRELRKAVASREEVPAFTVFTNDQLAEMAKTRPTSSSALKAIEGVGDSRYRKYGEEFLSFLSKDTNGRGDGKELEKL